MSKLKLLVLDNYDSFTYNLVHLIEKVSDIEFDVVRNDAITLQEINHYDKILLSPGPGLPSEAGIMPQLIKEFGNSISILGVCLGMQAIGEAYGAKLKNLENVCHGQSMPLYITKEHILFQHCPKTFNVGRYHSWVVDNVDFPAELEVTSVDAENNIMSLKHKHLNIHAVQFHPESILSEYGEVIISNWINLT